ncbi:MAG: class I SAM-dependent methyltransferase [Clostridiales bacterium]|nr:class I SAM-dependent methyltransferase [Clostridiales bacterium]
MSQSEQYKTATNLNIRISIHQKYSVNKQGISNWIVSHYDFKPNSHVLELGCGTGAMWKDNPQLIAQCNELVLTDISEGMLKETKVLLEQYNNICYKVVDAINIPYEDKTFDYIIANMMLYHTSNLNKALSEISRVLKADGVFSCVTYGENGIMPYLEKLLSEYNFNSSMNKSFTIQNGEQSLSKHFSHVQRVDYPDRLEVTDSNDVVEYIKSCSSMPDFNCPDDETVKKIVEAQMINGVITIPKEYGMFICNK